MADWEGLITELAGVLEATLPTAWNNGIYYPEEAVSVAAKVSASQLPFLLWSFELEVEGDDDEFGPVRILIVAQKAAGAAGALARIVESKALQAALQPLKWDAGYVMGKPRIETGNGLAVNAALQDAGHALWAYGVTAQVRI